MGKPIEFLSNFYLKSERGEDGGRDDEDSQPISFRAKRFRVDAKNANEVVDEVVDAYRQLHTVVVLYESRIDLKYFLSLFCYKFANIRKRSEFEDVMVINRCVLL